MREQTIDLLLQTARGELPTDELGQMVATARDKSGQSVYRATLTFRGEWPQRPGEPVQALSTIGG